MSKNTYYVKSLCFFLFLFGFFEIAIAQTQTFKSGSVIINMGGGSTPTQGNSLKPYGLVYSLLKNYQVPVSVVIGQSKVKDGIDFTYNGTAFKGGTFVIPAEFRSTAVNSLLSSWASQGVLLTYTTSDITLNVTYKLSFAPRWALDSAKGSIAVPYLTAAGIPTSAYSFKSPATLAGCDDIFVLPHADPTWASHKNLYFWNRDYKGAIWASCHAVSVIENLTGTDGSGNPIKMNFLSTTGLVNYGLHKQGTAPYTNYFPTDPMTQFMGNTDAAQFNGSEQVYLPLIGGGWNAGVKILTQSTTQADIPTLTNGPVAVNIYGRAYNDANRGYVFYEGGHSVSGTSAAAIAGQRMFMNFSFFAMRDKASSSFTVALTGLNAELKAGTTYNGLTASVSPAGTYTYQWKSSVAGTFSNPNSATTSFTPSSSITSSTTAVITCIVTDNCSRTVFDSKGVTILPANPPITASNITQSLNAGCATVQTVTFNVFDYNVDANAGTRTLTAVSGLPNGSFSFNAAGNITYTSSAVFEGNDVGTYTISNGTSTATGNLTVSVGSSALAPVLNADAASAIEDNLTVINVLGNDLNNSSASSGNKLYIKNISTKPSLGYVYINADGTLSYLSKKDASSGTGSDSFKYLACNDQNYCAEATVTITLQKDACTTGNYQTGINVSGTTTTTTFTAVRDSYMDSTSNKTTTNYGTSTTFLINGKASAPKRPALQFDLSSIPSTATVNSATLTLTFSANTYTIKNGSTNSTLSSSKNPFPATIYGLRRTWTETGITWQRYNGTNYWTTAGASSSTGDYTTTGSSTVYLANSSLKAVGDTLGADITTLAQGWVTTPSSNNGFILVPRSTGSNTLDIKFYSKDYTTTTAYQPKLSVRYTTASQSYPCSAIPTTYKPVAYPDFVTTGSNAQLTINVMSNDANFYSRTNTLSSVTTPAHGTASISSGQIVYTPSGSFFGTDTLTYTIQDATNSTSSTATVFITVTRVAPKINADAASTNSGTAVTINIAANDTDPQGTIDAPVITVTPLNGTAVISGSSIIYTPSAGFTGKDSLIYQRSSISAGACDKVLSDTAIVRITVINQAPVAVNDTVTTFACTPIKINSKSNDADPEGTPLTLSVVTNPSNGSVVVNAEGGFTYTPTANYVGTDQFTYRVTDGSSDALTSNTATVYITVSGASNLNHAPTAVNDADVTNVNQTVNTVVLANDSDQDNDDLQVSITAPGLLAPANGTITLLANGMIQYTPNANFTGTDSYQYQICDSHPSCSGNGSLCSVATVTITVKPVPVTIAGTVWDDADGTALGTFNNIQNGGEVGTSANGSLYVYLIDNTNTILDVSIVDEAGSYQLLQAPPLSSNLKLVVSTQALELGATLASGSLPSGWTGSSPLVMTGVSTNTSGLTGKDFGIGQYPVSVSYSFTEQINTGSLVALDATKVTGTDGDGNIVSIHYTSFPTNTTSFKVGGTTYTSGTWPGAGVTVAYNTAISILPVAGTTTPVISFKVLDNSGLESVTAGAITVPFYVALTPGTISGSATICGSAIPSTFSSPTDASGGRSTIIYQWQQSTDNSNFTDITNANSASYTPGTSVSVTTYYRRKVSTASDAAVYSNVITVTVNALPTIQTTTDGSRTGTGTVTISGTASAGATIDWYAVYTGGSVLSGGTGTLSYTTPSIATTTTYYAEARNTTTGCVSAARTPVYAVVTGTINPGFIGSNQTQCGTGTPDVMSSITDASGVSNILYQWQSSTSSTFADGGTNLSDDPSSTTTDYTPATDISVTTYYRRKAYTTGGSAQTAYSNIISVTVNALPAAPTVTAAARTGSGSVTLSASVSAGVTVDWYNASVSGTLLLQGSTTYTTPSITQTTDYFAEARNTTTGCVSSARTTVTATINPNLSAGTIAGGTNFCGSGTPTTISSSTTALGGTGAYTYQWQVSTTSSTAGFTDIGGANAVSYTPSSSINTTTYFRRKVTTGTGEVAYTDAVTFLVLPLPIVAIAPSSAALTIGSSKTLIANGANTYSWSPSTGLSATNTATVTASPVSTTTYTVVGTDGNGCTNSATVVVTVNPLLVAGSIAADQTICVGSTPNGFTSVSTGSGGTGTISYQWQQSTNNVNFTNIPSATGVTYNSGALTQTTYFRRGAYTAEDAIVYTSVVTVTTISSVGGIVSGGAAVCTGTNSTTLTLTGNVGSVTKWQSSNTSDFSGTVTDIANTATTYTAANLSANTYYRAVVKNSSCSAVNSSIAGITMNPLPTITVSPSVTSITKGAALTLTASGGTTYSWSPNSNLSAANTASVSASPVSDIVYTVTGTDGNGCSNTATSTITVNPILSAGSIAADQTICSGTAPAAFVSAASGSGGTGTISYQWQQSTDNSNFTNIPGANADTYAPGTLTQTTYYRRGALTSNDAVTYTGSLKITVLSSVGGTVNGSATVCSGNNNTPLSLSGITGSVVKWQSSTTPDFSSGVADIANTTTSLSAVNLVNTTYYRAVVEAGSCAVATSLTATVTVNALPVVTITPTSAGITIGSGTTLTAGGALNYSWTPNTAISSTNTTSVVVNPTFTTTYTVTGTDANNCSNAASVVVTVNPRLNGGSIASNQTICKDGTPAAFTSSEDASGGTGSITYQWQSSTDNLSFSDIAGANSATYQPAALTATTYYRRAATTTNDGTVYTGSVTVTVKNSAGGTLSGSATVCAGNNTASLSLTGITGTVQKWQSATTADFLTNLTDINNTAGVTSLVVSNLLTTTYYHAVVSDGGCSLANSSLATVTVNALPDLTVSSNITIAAQSSTVLTAGGAQTYTWTPSTGLDVTNAASVTATPNATTTYTVVGATALGCASSASVTVTVTPNVAVLDPGTIAADQVICKGTAPSGFTSTTDASGGAGTIISYQWQSSTDNINFTNIAGANAATFTETNNLAQDMYYRRAASTDNGADGTVYTASVKVTVNESVGGTISSDAQVCSGTNNTPLTLSGYKGSVVKWQSSSTADFSAGVNDIVNTTAVLSISNLTATTYYRAVVQAATCGTVNSSVVSITVVSPPAVSISPTSFTIPSGTSATLSVTGNADSYLWTPSTALSQTTGASVVASPASSITYTVTGTKTIGQCTTSATASVTVVLPLSAGSIAADQTICPGATPAAFTSSNDASGGSASISYQWQQSTNNISFTDIPGANSATYQAPALSQNTYYRRAASTANDAAVYTGSVKVTVQTAAGGTISGAATVCAGTNNTPLSLTGVTGTITKWQSSTSADFSTGVSDIVNTTSSLSASNLTQTTYYRAVVQLGGCSTVNSNSVTVTVNPLPVVNVSPLTATISSGSSVTLTASGANTYSWVPSTALSAVNTISVTASPTSNTTYIVTGTATATGCINTASAEITVNQPLTAGNIAASQTICSGTAPAQLTSISSAIGGTGAISYQWQSSTDNVTFTDIPAATSITYQPLTLTQNTYYRRAAKTSNDAFVYTGSVKITIQTSVGGSLSGSATVCSGSNTTSLSLSGYTGNITKWQSASAADFSGTVTDIANTSAILSVSSLTKTTYYRAVVTNNTCPSDNSTVAGITVNSLPTVTVSPSAPVIAKGSSVTLVASGNASSYSWSPSAALSATNTATVTANPLNTTSYTVTGTITATGCVSGSSVTVTVIDPGTIGADQSNCGVFTPTTISSTSDASGAVPITYTWQSSTTADFSSGVTTIAGAASAAYSPGTASATTYYRRVATYSGVSFNSNIITVTVKAVPVATAGAVSNAVCVGETIGLTSSGGSSYSWTGPNGFSSALQNPSKTGAISADGGTYTVTVTGANGCVSTASTSVTVNSLPTISVSPSAPIINNGNSKVLTASGASTYAWSPATGLSATTGSSVTANPGVTTTYMVTGTSISGCTNTATVTVSVVDALAGTIGSNQTNCGAFTPATLTSVTEGSGAGVVTYQWQSSTTSATTGFSNISGAVSSSYSPGLVSVTTYLRRVATTDGNSLNSNVVTVTIEALPVVTIGSNSPVCVGSAINLTSSGGVNYSWTGPNGFASSLQNPSVNSSSLVNAGTYTVTVTGLNNCSTTASTNVTVNALPSVTVNPSSAALLYGNSVQLTAAGADNYSWSPSTGLSVASTATVTASPITTTVYTVTGTQALTGCVNTATITVVVNNVLNPDFGVTLVNVPLPGNVSVNDAPSGGTYGTPVPSAANPTGAVINMNTDGTYTFTSPKVGVYTYYVPVCASGQSSGCPVTPLVITVNDSLSIVNPPVANPDIATVASGSSVTINQLLNDRCANPDCSLNTSSVTIVTNPLNGVVVINPGGTLTYTANGGFAGKDSLLYSVCDNSNPALCKTAWVYITVIGASTAPAAYAADDYNKTQPGISVSGNVLSNDKHTGGATLTVTDKGTVPSDKGSIVLNSDGTYVFTPAAGFTGPVDIKYTTCGGTPAACASATLHILVSPQMLIDAVDDDFRSVAYNGAKGATTSSVLDNDKLNNVKAGISQVNLSLVSNGGITGLSFDAAGALIIPANTTEGTYTVTYSICDKSNVSKCDQANVLLTIGRGLSITATSICKNDVPYIRYTVVPNFTAAANPVTLTWLNSDQTVLTAQGASANQPLTAEVLWPGAVLDAQGNAVDWPGWFISNGKWVQGADGFEKMRPEAYLVVSVNPTDTIRISYPPATPACNAAPPANLVALDPGTIAASQVICGGSTPAAFTSVTAASGGTGVTSYQWQQSTDSVNFINISGATAASFNAGALNTKTWYRRMASTTANEVAYSNVIAVTTVSPPVIAGISGPCALQKDSVRTFSAAAAVPQATRYVWTLPSGYTGSSTTNSIDSKPGTSNGVISVQPFNGSCAGNIVNYSVSVIDYAQVTLDGVPVKASGNNNSQIKMTVTLYDAAGNRINCSGGKAVINFCNPNPGSFSSVVDNNDGTYTSFLTASANTLEICGTVGGIPIQKKATVTFTGPQASIKGNGPILATETPKLTFTMSEGRAPFTVIYKSAKSNKTDTITNYSSGTPVSVALIPSTTLYTLLSVIDANGERRDNNFTRDTASIVVLAPKVVITLKSETPVKQQDSSWATRIFVKTKNIGDLDLTNSQARLNLRDVFPLPVTYTLDSVKVQGKTVVPNRNYDGTQNQDLFARLNKQKPAIVTRSSSGVENGMYASPDGSASLELWNEQSADLNSEPQVYEDGHSIYMFGPLSTLPVNEEADVTLWLHVKPNGYTEPFVMQAVALGTGSTDGATALASSISNDNEDVSLHPEVTKQGSPVPTVINLFPSAVIGVSLSAGTPVLQGNGTYNVLLSYKLKNYGNVNLKTIKLFQNLGRAIGLPSSFSVVGPVTATNNIVANPAFDGKLDTNMILSSSILGYKQESQLQYTINIAPNQLSVIYKLQAIASGFSDDLNTTVADLSNDGIDPDTDGNNIPSEKVVTEIIINTPVPPLVPGSIGIKKGNTTVLTDTYCASANALQIIPTGSNTGGLDNYQYQWQSSSDSINFRDINGAEDSIYTTTQLNNTIYLRRATISGSQVKYSNVVLIKINPLPAKPVITASGPLTLPVNGSVTLTSSAATGNLWSNGAVTNSITVNAGAVGAYAVTVTDVNGCSRGSDTSRIVPPPPSVTDATYIIGSVSNPVNSGVQVSPYNGTVTGSGPALRFYTVSAGGVLIPVPVLPSTPGVYTYYVSQVINGIESALVPYKVTMLDPVKVVDLHKVLSSPPVLQADGSFLLGFTLYVINLRNELLDTVRVKDDLSKVFPAYAGFQVVDITASGKLKVNPLFNGNSQTALLSDVSQLAGMQTDSVKIKLKVIPNGFNGTLNNVAELTAKSPYGLITVRSDDTTQMRITSGTGQPVRMATPFTIPLVDIFIPEGFSPNRDGTNDLFVITRPYTVTIHLEIYNRWGNLVYKAGDYKNDWDGRGNQPGRIADELPDGTYYYLIQATDKNTGSVRKFTGFITLKR